MTRMTKARTEYLLCCHDAAKEPSAHEAFARGWEKALEAASVWMLAAAQEINRVQMGRGHVLKDEFGMKHPVMPVDEQVELMEKHFQIWRLNEREGSCVDEGRVCLPAKEDK